MEQPMKKFFSILAAVERIEKTDLAQSGRTS